MVGSKDGLQPVEKTVIDRAVRNVYRPYLADPIPEKMPILQDLYDELLRQPEPEARRVAAALELYVTGSLNMFNHRTNVELENRLVCFNIKELGKQLKQLGMLVIQDQVWNRVTVNRAAGKTTRYYCDECCNYDGGNCIALDDGEECVCVQSISYSLLCRWFRAAVLPLDRELETALFHRLDAKRCAVCGALFIPGSNRAKYCPECAGRMKRIKAAQRKRKQRAKCHALGAENPL